MATTTTEQEEQKLASKITGNYKEVVNQLEAKLTKLAIERAAAALRFAVSGYQIFPDSKWYINKYAEYGQGACKRAE